MIIIKIFLGFDHQGVKVKDEIINYLIENGFNVSVCPFENDETDDYPCLLYTSPSPRDV